MKTGLWIPLHYKLQNPDPKRPQNCKSQSETASSQAKQNLQQYQVDLSEPMHMSITSTRDKISQTQHKDTNIFSSTQYCSSANRFKTMLTLINVNNNNVLQQKVNKAWIGTLEVEATVQLTVHT